jgi:molybdate transport system ATP-binding protein
MQTQIIGNNKPALEVEGLSVSLGGQTILSSISFSLQAGESLAVIGASGSGKTSLLKALANQLFFRGKVNFHPKSPKIYIISRQHRFNNLSNQSDFYYQQRFNSFDADDSRTVAEELRVRGKGEARIAEVLDKVGISHRADTRLIQLSNGEHKRFQIAEAISEEPDWILLDSPYIGLDVGAREMLNELLSTMMRKGMQLILVSGAEELPSGIHKTYFLEGGVLVKKREGKGVGRREEAVVFDVQKIPAAYDFAPFETAVRMENVTIQYGDKIILDQVNWTVKAGECWAVLGHNGSGKSTLLSLINADNPQAFSQKIWLFDKRKGSGESIWDIKRNIGYISPELHHYFESGAEAKDIVASGLFDTMGLFRVLHPDQAWLALQWMEALQIRHLADRSFVRLSDSEQRRVLLARALVKNPPMLILDEPCQGMDDEETAAFTAIINEVCQRSGKTLIYVSHYEKDIPPCVTHRLYLREGKVVI